MTELMRVIRLIVWPPSWGTFYFDIGDDPPAPDPAIGEAAKASAEVGMKALDLQKDQFAWAKELGKEQLGLARNVVDKESSIADANKARADEQWDRYRTTFAPVEDQMVKDAMGYDSEKEMDRRSSMAAADVSAAADAGRAATSRSLTRRGVNVNSGAYTAGLQPLEISKAAMSAGGMNAAREGVRDRAIGLRAGAASFGRGLPNTAAQAYGLATNANNSAVSNENATVNSVISNTGTPVQYGQMGLQGLGQAGSLYNQMFNGQMAGYGAKNDQMAGLGNLAGTLGAAWIKSSKTVKEDREPIDGELILAGLDSLPVDSWKYKKGVADEGEHVGPMAEDVNDRFGESVAPGGAGIDLISMNGILMAGLKALNKKVDAKLGTDVEDATVIGLTPRSKRRETEPRRVA